MGTRHTKHSGQKTGLVGAHACASHNKTRLPWPGKQPPRHLSALPAQVDAHQNTSNEPSQTESLRTDRAPPHPFKPWQNASAACTLLLPPPPPQARDRSSAWREPTASSQHFQPAQHDSPIDRHGRPASLKWCRLCCGGGGSAQCRRCSAGCCGGGGGGAPMGAGEAPPKMACGRGQEGEGSRGASGRWPVRSWGSKCMRARLFGRRYATQPPLPQGTHLPQVPAPIVIRQHEVRAAHAVQAAQQVQGQVQAVVAGGALHLGEGRLLLLLVGVRRRGGGAGAGRGVRRGRGGSLVRGGHCAEWWWEVVGVVVTGQG
jgi:hypothetical protein